MKTTISFILFSFLVSTSFAQKNGVPILITNEEAQFPGGTIALRAFIIENIKYPDEALKLPLEGDRVIVRFCVNQKGEIENVKIIKNIPECQSCSTEALRVMALMPIWKPAFQDEKPVKAYFNLPFIFMPSDKTTETISDTK